MSGGNTNATGATVGGIFDATGSDDFTMCRVTERLDTSNPLPYISENATTVTVTLASRTRSGHGRKEYPTFPQYANGAAVSH